MVEKQSSSTFESWKKIAIWISKNWARNLAGLTAAVYILGFLVVNANLSQYGIYDLEFGNARYVFGGCVFVAYLVMYYLFGGHLVISITNTLESGIISYIRRKGDNFDSKMFAFSHFVDLITDIVFLSCLGASLFSIWFFSISLDPLYMGCLVVVFLIDRSVISKFEHRYPKSCAMVGATIKVPAVYFFFHVMSDWKLGAIFWSYVFITFIANFFSEIIEKSRVAKNQIIHRGIFTVLMLLFLALSFGKMFYGEIPRNMGGGKPLYADVKIREEYASLFPNRENSTLLPGVKIVHITGKHLFIEENGEVIRVPDHSIVGIKTRPPEDDANKEN